MPKSPSSSKLAETALPSDGLFRFRLDLSYDGTDYAGWAKQPGMRTVSSELMVALEQIFGASEDDFRLRVAGRTDAGVHATGQVTHFDLTKRQLARLGRAADRLDFSGRLNSLLPKDIRVASVVSVPGSFDARYSATGRRYRYRIADANATHNPLRARDTLWHLKQLDVEAMREAAALLLGLHDFAAFCKPRPGATTIRNLRKVSVRRLPESRDGVIEIVLEADAFCHNMVRSIVGALIACGQGRLALEDLAEILAGRRRVSAFKVVAPQGLVLERIFYPAERSWAAQAKRTKNKRDLAEIGL